jgi:hypothetical protein
MSDRIYGRKLDIEEASPPKEPTYKTYKEPTSNDDYLEILKYKLWHIHTYPGAHRHTFEELRRCSIVKGILDLKVWDAHKEAALFGTNGGINCDVSEGPCACGAWH